jgi:hypothetical protein
VARCFVTFANRERITSRLFLNKIFLIFATKKRPKSHSSKAPLGEVVVIFAEMERRRGAQRGAPPGRNVGAPSRGELGTLI